jgi:hypothetical protein
MTMNCKNRSGFAEWEGKIDSQEENIIIPLGQLYEFFSNPIPIVTIIVRLKINSLLFSLFFFLLFSKPDSGLRLLTEIILLV